MPDAPKRRKRYQPGAPKYALTPPKMELLAYIAECGFLTTEQCQRIQGLTRKQAYDRLRDLLDWGCARRTAIPFAYMFPELPHGPEAAAKASPDIHLPTPDGLKALLDWGLVSEETARRKAPQIGPANALFAAHEVLVREARVWLEECARADGGKCEWWVTGESAHVEPARPDALFLYRLPCEPARRIVGLVEADMGTERKDRWEKKAEEYGRLIGSDALAEVTGGRRGGRLCVLTLTVERREWIGGMLDASPAGEHAWIACKKDLDASGMGGPSWRVKGGRLVPFAAPELLRGKGGEGGG